MAGRTSELVVAAVVASVTVVVALATPACMVTLGPAVQVGESCAPAGLVVIEQESATVPA
jgi:hypothetical protein